LAEKTEKLFFHPLTNPSGQKRAYWPKKEQKKINPPAEKSARRLLGIEKFTFA